MVLIKRIRPVMKNKYYMTHIVYAKTPEQLLTWRKAYKKKYKQIFYPSPRKDKPGVYALISK